MNQYEPHHWKNICGLVTEKATLIFPHIKSNGLKSSIISNLFETQSAYYFNSIGLPTVDSKNDKDPDLIFDGVTPCEIKVTNAKKLLTKSLVWMGGEYSKRSSDFILAAWHIENNDFYFLVIKTVIHMDEWERADNGRNTFYGTKFHCNKLYDKEHEVLIGSRTEKKFLLEKI